MMGIIYSRESEKKYGTNKLGYKYNFADSEARNAFKIGEVTPSLIKCAHGFNHYSLRDSLINNNIIEEYCL